MDRRVIPGIERGATRVDWHDARDRDECARHLRQFDRGIERTTRRDTAVVCNEDALHLHDSLWAEGDQPWAQMPTKSIGVGCRPR
jgi:hypothetical protein